MRLFDFNHSSMARKILAHKKHVGGLEAPRNSLELQVEMPHSYCSVTDEPYSYQVEEDWSEQNYYPIEASMEKLINDEISKQSHTRRNAPSIVARLMGVDTLPLDTKSVVDAVEKKDGYQGVKLMKNRNRKGSVDHYSSNSKVSRQTELDSTYYKKDKDGDRWSTGQKLGKPRPREHPQEEELQKFKREFEAWRAARFKECSKLVDDIGSTLTNSFAEENLQKEKIAHSANSEIAMRVKSVEPNLTFNARLNEKGCSQHHHGHKMEYFPAEQKESFPLRSRTISRDFLQSSVIDYDQKLDAAPTRIIILKPGPDRIREHEESWTSSSGTFEDRASIEDFLEEVKERLKSELQGKTLKRSSGVRGSGIETPYKEKPSDPKQIARHIANHVRESVTRDLGMNLLRSESTRSYRSEIQVNSPDSPEFVNRDTRKFLSERLRNVLKRETHLDAPVTANGSLRSSVLDSERRIKQTGAYLNAANEQNYWEFLKDEQDIQTRSFRRGDDDGVVDRELSPRNLIRSLSAPVSGTSFGKLLLEDRHVLTGAQIRRKHEATENLSENLRKRKKERFNFRKRVSDIRDSFALRGRLFGKKIHSTIESHGFEHNCIKDIMSGPTVVMNYGERHENSTEVPPSPASVCSSTQEDFWKAADYLSPISTPDITIGDDNPMPQVFREISSNLNELRRQLNELESDGLEDRIIEQDIVESERTDIEDKTEAYVRDLLIASGLYDESSDKCLLRRDAFGKVISNSVFEEVEDQHRKLNKEKESSVINNNKERIDRKLLFDLLNETLKTILGPPAMKSRIQRKVSGYSVLPPPRGRKLLDTVWKIICEYLYPPTERLNQSLERMVTEDMESTPWADLMDEEISALSREVESVMMGELVDEVVKDICS